MRAVELFQFQGQRSEAGYVVRGGLLSPVSEAIRSVPPPPPDLFLRFAQLDPSSEDQIQHFANGFGLLGMMDGGLRLDAEPLGRWRERIYQFRKAVWLWEKIQTKDAQQLDAAIKREPGPVECFYFYDPLNASAEPELIAGGSVRPGLFQSLKGADAIGKGRFFLRWIVNDELAERASPTLLWVPERGDLGLFIVPVPWYSLYGFLWIQLARAISGDCAFRACAAPNCGKLMLVAGDGSGSRSHKTTCSPACRVRLSARRVAARQLRKENIKPRQIAKRLNATVEKVKSWLGEE